MRTRQYFVVGFCLVLFATACSAPTKTIEDLQGQSFNSNTELLSWLGCRGLVISTEDRVGPAGAVWNPENVVDTVSHVMGSPAVVAEALQVGDVWVLIDGEGRVFGGLEPGEDISWCGDWDGWGW